MNYCLHCDSMRIFVKLQTLLLWKRLKNGSYPSTVCMAAAFFILLKNKIMGSSGNYNNTKWCQSNEAPEGLTRVIAAFDACHNCTDHN